MNGSILCTIGIWLLYATQREERNGHRYRRAWLAVAYRCFSLIVAGFDIPVSTRIGKNLRVHHGQGLVVSSESQIGNSVTLRQNTTIGTTNTGSAGPVILDKVNVGANVVIIGPITIGKGATIGAGSVVVKDVPAGATVVGNPARIISSASDGSGLD